MTPGWSIGRTQAPPGTPVQGGAFSLPHPGGRMRLEGEQTLLRVYLRNTDKHGWGPLAQFLLRRAMDQRLEGATLIRCESGLDLAGRLLEPRWWSLVRRVPEVLEVFDSPRAVGA